jgi:hypothetical protein
MPAHDQADPAVDPGAVPAPAFRVSRRSLLRGAAGAGAVGIAAVSGAGAVMAAARPATAAAPADARTVNAARLADAGPLVVYLRDAATGEMEVFAGAGQARFRDPALAARLLSRAQTDVQTDVR